MGSTKVEGDQNADDGEKLDEKTPAEVFGGMLVSETAEDFDAPVVGEPFRSSEMVALAKIAYDLAFDLKTAWRRP